MQGSPTSGSPLIVKNPPCYFLGRCDKYISTDVSEDQVVEERYPDLNEEEDIRFDEIRQEHWRDVAE